MRVICDLCPHGCSIEEGHTGLCRARKNHSGKIICSNYGKLTAIALDPIEKKPLQRFMSGSMILSVGSYGCNLDCAFCQNHSISMADDAEADTVYLSPEELVAKALELVPSGNIGIAYTYNEPLISYEYLIDTAKLAKQHGLKNVVVTNGYINESPLLKLLPFIDAMNIDLKGFTDKFYRKVKGDLETVKNTIVAAAKECHVELTSLIIPNENDSAQEIKEMAEWISNIRDDIPLHISRFFPRYRYENLHPTDAQRVYQLADISRQYLKYVYTGNC